MGGAGRGGDVWAVLAGAGPVRSGPGGRAGGGAGAAGASAAAMYRALYSFRSAEPNSLPFAAGETFLLLERSNQHWWLVTRAGSGETGYAPASYLQRLQVGRAGRGRLCRRSRGWAALPWPLAGSGAFLAVLGWVCAGAVAEHSPVLGAAQPQPLMPVSCLLREPLARLGKRVCDFCGCGCPCRACGRRERSGTRWDGNPVVAGRPETSPVVSGWEHQPCGSGTK